MTESELRALIGRLARNKYARAKTPFPCRWEPYDVFTKLGIPFTEEGAWQFIAECAESEIPIETIKLRIPPDEVGYVMKVDIEAHARLYIKVQIYRGHKIIGRSFHYSTEDIIQKD